MFLPRFKYPNQLTNMRAGLCHDLGHAPFSHTFESEIMPRLDPHSNWCVVQRVAVDTGQCTEHLGQKRPSFVKHAESFSTWHLAPKPNMSPASA